MIYDHSSGYINKMIESIFARKIEKKQKDLNVNTNQPTAAEVMRCNAANGMTRVTTCNMTHDMAHASSNAMTCLQITSYKYLTIPDVLHKISMLCLGIADH